MTTPIVPADAAGIARAAELLQRAEIVAFPTETVYGLGGNALDPRAVDRIFAAKGRPAFNPLIIHTADAASARALASTWPPSADRLATQFWPGPLTLVLPRGRGIPDAATAGLPSVALRVPGHPVALALLQAAGIPLAAPSANRSGRVSPTRADHVAAGLETGVALILDGGPTNIGIESTVIDLTETVPRLLRPGMIGRESLEAVLGPIALGPPPAVGAEARASPGMLERHYAPRASVILYGGPGERSRTEALQAARALGGLVGGLLVDDDPAGIDLPMRLGVDPASYARELYGALHHLDIAGASAIVVQGPPAEPGWAAIHDRLRRAAAGRGQD